MPRKQKAAASAASQDFEHDGLLLRTTDSLGRAYQGFQYPLEAEPGHIMVCPDWNPQPVCGGGFHGLLDGLGNYGLMKAPGDTDAIWWIWGVIRSEGVDIEGEKYKFPRMKLIYRGGFGGAMAQVSMPMAQAILAKVAKVTSEATPEGQHATGDGGASSATGSRGASSATGDGGASSATGSRGASSATGYGGASSATGSRGASSATGSRGASSATGDGGGAISLGSYSSASAEGAGGIAVAAGYRARGKIGPDAILVLIERDDEGRILNKLIAAAGEHDIEAGKWYELQDGKAVEVQP